MIENIIESYILVPKDIEKSLVRVLKQDIVDLFGGLSISDINGLWYDSKSNMIVDEGMFKFTIAHLDTDENRKTILDLAAKVKILACHISVYVNINGKIFFV